MRHWIIGGKTYNEEEYAEYEKQENARWKGVQRETWRLIRTLGEAYQNCEKYMEDNPQYPFGMKDDAERRELKILEKLRSNLGAANEAPRCEKVREDGTRCGCPKMKNYRYCYAHERMLQMQSQKLELPAQEDANGIQMAIMRVQKALLDDEISVMKARLLLYSLRMASGNLRYTTFEQDRKDTVTEMPEKTAVSSRQPAACDKTFLPRIKPKKSQPNTHHGDTEARRNPTDGQSQNPLTTKDTKDHGGRSQSGEVYANLG